MSFENTLMYKEIMSEAAGLKAAEEKNTAALQVISSAMKEKKPVGIVIAARGTSDHAALFAKYIFETYCGIGVSFAAPSVLTVYGGAPSLENYLVIGISQSGKAADAMEVLKHGRSCGAATLAITNDASSPMAKLCDFHLDCAQGEEKSVAATKTFTAQLYLVLLLAAAISENEKLKKAAKAAPTQIKSVYKSADLIEHAAMRYRFAQEAFMLGRGLAYPLALEFGLKTMETSYVRSRGYATSDFYHGPIAQIPADMPVFLFSICDELKEDTEKMMARLVEFGADMFLFTDNMSLLAKADAGILLPEGGEIENAFAACTALQLFACALSVAKRLDPDKPRGLNKVTITK